MSSPSATPTAAVEETAAPMETAEVPPTREEQIARFESLLSDGRKAFLLKDWTAANENLSQAAELSVQLYGEFSPQAYLPHYFYGYTQLELAAIEKEVVDVELAEDGEEYKEIKDGLKQAMTTIMESMPPQEEAEGEKPADEEPKAEEKPEETPKAAVEEQKEQPMETSEEKPAVAEGGDAETAEETKEEEELEDEPSAASDDESEAEIDRAQLAFELLDYARLVVEKQTEKTPEWLKREWDVRVLLAQCAMNENNYAAAIDEHSKALDIVRSHFPEERREIAFLCVEMNRANRAAKKFDEAAANLDAAIAALREVKALKQKELEAAAEEAKSELQKLLTELDEMIGELEDEKRMNASVKKDAQETEEAAQQVQDKENTAVSNEVVIGESKLADAPIEVVTYKRKAKDNDGHEDAEKKPKVDAEDEQVVA